MKCLFGIINFASLFYYSTYLIQFMGLTVLFQITFTFIYNTFNKKISILVK